GRSEIDPPRRSVKTRVSRARARAAKRRSSVGGRVARANVAQLRVLAILVGGAAGTLARASLADSIPHGRNEWPWATFAANLAGALLLGWLLVRLAERVAPTRYWRLLLGTGFAGALTT